MQNSATNFEERLAECELRIDEIYEREKSPQKKSFLDKLTALSPLISGVLIAAVGTGATISYNHSQMQISKLSSLDKYRPYLDSNNPVERKFGYKAFVDLGEEDFVIAIVAHNKDGAGLNELATIAKKGDSTMTIKAATAGDIVMAHASSEESQNLSPPYSSNTTSSISQKDGWAYLGHWMNTENKWETRYFDYETSIEPRALLGKKLKVRSDTGALNIRSGMPTPEGKFEKVIITLAPGNEVTVNEIKEWYSTGYMWAKIKYGT